MEPSTERSLPAGLDTEKYRRGGISYVPPLGCILTIKPLGWKRLLRANLVKEWLDVFHAGLRAIVKGRCSEDDVFPALIDPPDLDQPLQVRLRVKHARPSEAHPGCSMVSFRFIDPDPLLVTYLRDTLCQTPVIRPESRPRIPGASRRRP